MQSPTVQVTTVSTVASGAQVMGIDEAGMGTVLSILSNMYSDGSLAVAREYICNALDSHVEAGNSDPVLVTAPSHFDPTFTVQDFGVGLSHDEVLNVYAKYGASTKRHTNDQIGAFGIGAKSAFTVGTQFVVTAVKDGEVTVALFALADNGAPTVNIVQRGETDEPNGVKVEIGVRDVQGVQNALDKLTTTLPVGSVLVDGVQPASVWTETKALADDVHVTWRADRYDSADPAWVVVMGGVPYNLPDALVRSLEHRQQVIVQNVRATDAKVILSVPIGAVDITPSREDLMVTDKSTAALNTAVEKFNSLLPGWISEQIDEAPSVVAAMILRRHLQSRIGSFARDQLDSATWKGRRLDIAKIQIVRCEEIRLKRARNHYYSAADKYWNAKRDKGFELVPQSEIETFLFVTGVPERRVRSVQLAAKPYLIDQQDNHNKEVVKVIALFDTRYQEEWFDTTDPAVQTVDFDSFVTQWKPAFSPQSGGSGGGAKYPIGEPGRYAETMTTEELNDLGERILYLTSDQQEVISTTSPFLREIIRDNTVVFLKSTHKEEVFLKRVPLAEQALPHIRKLATKTLKSLSQDDLDTIAAQEWSSAVSTRLINFLNEHRNSLTNPVVLNVLDTHKKVTDLRSQNGDRIALLRQAAQFLSTELDTSQKASFSVTEYHKVANGLPLLSTYLDAYYRATPLGNAHLVQYIDSIAL